mgnify:CR=1 FL=1
MAEFKNAEEMLKNYTTHGCFVVAGERPNVMTASWGFFGEMWGKKVAVVPVRDSRFTKGIIDEKQEFTLCVPFGDKYKKELLYCGTKSGRDCDKVKDFCLKITPAKKVNTYVIDGCGAYYECKVLHTAKSPITTIFTLRKSSKNIKRKKRGLRTVPFVFK